MKLAEAQESRRARARQAVDSRTDALLDQIGLSESDVARISLGTENVSPDDRKKLKGIIDRLRGAKHSFTTCMRDLKKHKPEWSEDRRKRTCAVLKQIAKPGSQGGSRLAVGSCPVVDLDDGALALLEYADTSSLEGRS